MAEQETDTFQKELFDFDGEKTTKPRKTNVIRVADFTLTIDSEHLVFIVIGIILVSIVLYAIGVEMGKGISSGAARSRTTAPASSLIPREIAPSSPLRPDVTGDTPLPQIAIPGTQTIPAGGMNISTTKANVSVTAAQSVEPALRKVLSGQSAQTYMILAASFKRKEWANQEVQKLLKGGLEASCVQNGDFYVVAVGPFTDRSEAKRVLGQVKTSFKYTDAYIKTRP